MLKKEIFITLLITVFSLGLTGIAIADHGGHDNFDETISGYIEKGTVAEVEFTQPTAIELEHGNLNVQTTWRDSEPLVCDNDPVISNKVIASNDCRNLYEDIYRN